MLWSQSSPSTSGRHYKSLFGSRLWAAPSYTTGISLMQIHVAPSPGPPGRVLSPLFFPARALLLPMPCGKRVHPKALWSLLTMAAVPRIKSQLQPFSAATFPTTPTIHYCHQHSRIFQAFLAGHSKVWAGLAPWCVAYNLQGFTQAL